MGPIFVFAAWAFIGVVVGCLCFGVLALLSLLFHRAARRKAFFVSGVVSALVGASIPAVLMAIFFLQPDNPSADFHAVFDRDPAKEVVISGSASSAGTDFGHGTVEFKARGEILDGLVSGWHPGRVSLVALPSDVQLSPIQPCKELEVFFDDRSNRHSMMDYRAVVYCRERGLARATYSTLD